MIEFERRLIEVEKKQRTTMMDVQQLTIKMGENTKALEDFIELGKSFKFGIKLLTVIEKVAVWVTKVMMAVGVVWGAWKFIISETIQRVAK